MGWEAFRANGHLRDDYALLCGQLGLVGHHELMPSAKATLPVASASLLGTRASVLVASCQ